MENKKKTNYVNSFLKNKFGERTLKICVDGNFTCPNRDGKVGKGGCIFCSERGSGEHIKNSISSISKQVSDYFSTYRAQRANKFIVYFQNFTNTYDTITNLKNKYDAALIDDRIVGLAIATRPDCINEEIATLLASYTKKYYVYVELGLQTADEGIGKFINRAYTNETFSNAVKILNKYNIDVIAHMMVGLPGESTESIKNTVNFINAHTIQGLKVHSTYVIKNTKLADLYLDKKYTPISLEYYLETLSYILTHVSPNLIIHRISGDAPKDLLLAPDWNLHKKWILNGIDKKFREEDLWQGKYY